MLKPIALPRLSNPDGSLIFLPAILRFALMMRRTPFTRIAQATAPFESPDGLGSSESS
jgi:hypothetical protein